MSFRTSSAELRASSMMRFASLRASASCFLYSSSWLWASDLAFSAPSRSLWIFCSRASIASRIRGRAILISTKATIAKQMTPQTSSAVSGSTRSIPSRSCSSSWARRRADTEPVVIALTPALDDECEDETDQGERLDQSEADEHGCSCLTGHLGLAGDRLDCAREH